MGCESPQRVSAPFPRPKQGDRDSPGELPRHPADTAVVPALDDGSTPHRTLLDPLLRTAARRGGVVLVEGPAGAGRSTLLRQLGRLATEVGFTVAHGTADEVRRVLPLAPLASALEHATPTPPDARDEPPPGTWSIGRLQTRLTHRLRHGPLLVVLDDLQWADPTTLAGLRLLVPRLTGRPLLWVLARRTGGRGRATARLFELLRRHDEVSTLRLVPLPEEVVAHWATHVLGAPPSAELLRLAGAAAGNPAALLALLEGWREEGAVQLTAGTARLTGPAAEGQPPPGFARLVHARLRDVRPATRLLVDVAAVLGPRATPEELARLLARPVATLLPAVREARDAGLLVCHDDTIGFPRAPVRLAVLATVPEPLRGALHRQAAQLLLDRGGPLAAAAAHLVHGARPGDRQALAVLAEAATATAPSRPGTAARLALRGLELCPPDDEARGPLLTAAMAALTRCGPLPRAEALARDALARPLPAAPATRVRHGLALALLLGGRPTRAAATADRVLAEAERLDDREQAASLRDEALLVRCHARAASGVTSVVAAPTAATSRALTCGALGARAEALRRQGRLDEALRCARRAVRLAGDDAPGLWCLPPALPLAAVLVQRRDDAEADPALRRLADQWAGGAAEALDGVPSLLRAVLALARGAPEEAVARARGGLAVAEESGVALWLPSGWGVLAEVAVREGDLTSAEEYAARLATARGRLTGGDAVACQARCAYLAAQLAAARAEPDGVVVALRELRDAPAALRGLLAEEPTAAAWLVRADLAAGDGETAREVVRLAAGLAARSPRATALCAAAHHARGVLRADGAALAWAAKRHRDAWARASASEDLGVLHGRADARERAVAALERALAGYARIDARRDAARVRRRLRRLGVRRGRARAERRPASGWAALTDTERAVAALVAQGLTNRQVAVQMFLSPHTVGFHLRQVFRKLGVRSRVELARLHARAGDAEGRVPGSASAPGAGVGDAPRHRGGGTGHAQPPETGGATAPRPSPGPLSHPFRGAHRPPSAPPGSPAVIAVRAATMRSRGRRPAPGRTRAAHRRAARG